MHERTRGVPRLVNALADRSLLIGYVGEVREIAPELVDEAAADIPAIGATLEESSDAQTTLPDDPSWTAPAGSHRKMAPRSRQRSHA